jgi:hypothetical protein
VQLRLREAPQRGDRQRHDRHGQQVGDPGAGDPGHETAAQGAHDEGSTVDESVAADVPVERLAGAGLLDCESLDRATAIAAQIPDARWERVEIRPAMDVAGLEM